MSNPISRLNAALEGRYAIERELGEGGMATVYLAKDLKHNRNVALKVLKPELAAVVGAERFLAEIQVTANLQHPNILPLHDSGETEGFLFYVMPYVEGDTLKDRLDREHQLPVGDAVHIATDMAEALDYAHRQGVIHRDIKPANVLMLEGKPVISDFGIALAVGAAGGGRLTETGLSLGTPHYMSPEQAMGDQNVGPQTDTYALGCVLYEMLVGEPPFTGPNAQAVLGQIITSEAVSATEKRSSVPANVDAAVRKALEKLPADRFSRAQDLAAALGDTGFTHGSPKSAAMATRRSWGRPLVATTAIAAALAVSFAWSIRRPASSGPVARFVLSFEEMLALDFDAVGVEIAISADGARLVYVGQGESGEAQLFQRTLDALESVPIPGTEGARGAAFSPDGESVAFLTADAVKTISLLGGRTVTIDDAPNVAGGLDWGADGMIYFSSGQTIRRVPETGGAQETVSEGANDRHRWPDALPGGKGVLVTLLADNAAQSTIGVVGPEGGRARSLFPGVMARYSTTGHLVYTDPDGTLMGVPFDVERLEPTGTPVAVVQNISLSLLNSTSQFALSETGTLVYLSGPVSVGQRLLLVPFDGATDTVPFPRRAVANPKWSPNGQRLAFEDVGQIYVYDMESGGTPRQLTFDGTNQYPVWSHDGTQIAFTSTRGGTDGSDIFVVSADGDAPDRKLLGLGGSQFTRQWLASDLVVFENAISGGDLWWVNVSRPDETGPYLESSADLDDIAVSPDGMWAAYQSSETGTEEVYVRSFPVPRQPLPVSEGEGQFPRWSPDGTVIYYWQAEGAVVDTLFAVRIDLETSFSVLSRQPVLVGNYLSESWDLHPDGDRVVVAEADQSSRGRVIIVLNWFDELKARIPN